MYKEHFFKIIWDEDGQMPRIYKKRFPSKGQFILTCSESKENCSNDEDPNSIINEKYDKKYVIKPMLGGFPNFIVRFGDVVLYEIVVYLNYEKIFLGRYSKKTTRIVIRHTPQIQTETFNPNTVKKDGTSIDEDEWTELTEEEKAEEILINILSTKEIVIVFEYELKISFCIQYAINAMINRFGKCNIRNFYNYEDSRDFSTYWEDSYDKYLDGGGGNEWSDPPDW